MDEFTREVRVALARYGPATYSEVAELLGSTYDDTKAAVNELCRRDQARCTGPGGLDFELTRKGHLAVADVKARMEVPR